MPENAHALPPVPVALLRCETARIFKGYGLPEADAEYVANVLVEADLRGVHSHGVTRVPIYTERLSRGLFNARPDIRVVQTGAAIASIDGDNGMGAVVARKAVQTATEIASTAGSAVIGVKKTNHFGIAAIYAEELVAQGLIALVTSNAPPTMAPYGGRQAFFGTNPMAFGVPTPGERTILADMATSTVARGKIILARQRGEDIPPGWALDTEGRPTTNADAALKGVVLPFGGAKGSAIALLVDVLSAVMTGAGFGTDLPDFYEDLDRPGNIGHFFMAIDPARFEAGDAFLKRIGRYIEMIADCPPAEGFGEVLLPGEVEAQKRSHHLAHGVVLSPDILNGMAKAAERVGVALSLQAAAQ